MVDSMDNGDSVEWFESPEKILKLETLRKLIPLQPNVKENCAMEATPFRSQLEVLLKRGFLKAKRDATLTHLRWEQNPVDHSANDCSNACERLQSRREHFRRTDAGRFVRRRRQRRISRTRQLQPAVRYSDAHFDVDDDADGTHL